MGVNPLSPRPLYQQVRDSIERQILAGQLERGALIPSERELCDLYNVSSTTVRRALQELVRDGLIQRRMGIGSFVSSDAQTLNLLLLIVGFHQSDWRKRGYFFSDLIAGIATVAWENRAVFSVAHVPAGVEDVNALIYTIVEEKNFDGVLLRLEGDLTESHLVPFWETGFPYVVVKRCLPGRPIHCVVVDDVQGAQEATEHLIQLGHTRIGLITSRSIVVGRERAEGYANALQAHGIAPDPAIIVQTEDFLEESGYRAARQLLALPDRPTAVFAASDVLAFGIYAAVKEAGLRIPDDLSVVGYDDVPPSAQLSPRLTTVRTPYYDFGHEATQLLLDIINARVHAPRRVVIPHALVARESSQARIPATPVPVPGQRVDGRSGETAH